MKVFTVLHSFILPLINQGFIEFQIANAQFDPVIKMLLRLYGGELFSDFVKISESYLAKGLKIGTEEMINILKHLHALQVVIYQPVKEKPQLLLCFPGRMLTRLPLNTARMAARKKLIDGKNECHDKFCHNNTSLPDADDSGLF